MKTIASIYYVPLVEKTVDSLAKWGRMQISMIDRINPENVHYSKVLIPLNV